MNTESQHTHYTDLSEHDFGLHDEIRQMKSDIERITQERDLWQTKSENWERLAMARIESTKQAVADRDRLRSFVQRWREIIVGGDDPSKFEGWAQDFNNEANELLKSDA